MVTYGIILIFVAILGIKLMKPVIINKLLLIKRSEEVLWRGRGGEEENINHEPPSRQKIYKLLRTT